MHYLPILTHCSLPSQDGGRTTDSPAKSTQEPQRPKRQIRRTSVEHFDPSPSLNRAKNFCVEVRKKIVHSSKKKLTNPQKFCWYLFNCFTQRGKYIKFFDSLDFCVFYSNNNMQFNSQINKTSFQRKDLRFLFNNYCDSCRYHILLISSSLTMDQAPQE